MTDPFTIDDEPFVLVVPSGAAIPPGNITEAEWLALKDRVTVVEAGSDLGDLNDVDTSGIVDGETVVYDADTGTFVAGTAGGTIDTVRSQTGAEVNDVNHIYFRYGLRTLAGAAGVVTVQNEFGTAANTVAEGNHRHAVYRDETFTASASGTLSSGTRGLGSGNVTGLLPDRTYVIRATLRVDLRGEGTGAGYTLPRITLNGNTVNRFAQSRTVSGVDREASMSHPGVSVNGSDQSSVSVSAAISYQSGDPINIGASELVVSIESQR